MSISTSHLNKILTGLFLISVFLLSITKIADTDSWGHLYLGRAIFTLRGLPETEIFIYPANDMPFFYTSWLFGLLYYLAYFCFDVYGITLFKATVITAGFYIIIKDSLRPVSNHIVSIIVLTLTVVACRHRFVERPDTFLLVFWTYSIFSLNAYLYDGKKYFYLLPVIHLLWANSHSSIIIMLTPFIAFMAGGFIHSLLKEKGFHTAHALSCKQLKKIGLVLALSIGFSFINPNFLKQFTYGFEVMSSGWFGGIDELLPPTWDQYKSPYLISGIALISFILNWRRFSLTHFMLLAPFVILGLTSKRYMFLLAITAAPIIARNLSLFFSNHSFARPVRTNLLNLLCIVWLLIFTALGLTNKGLFVEKDVKFGFGFDYSLMPEKALKFMDKMNINGRILNQFHWGPYITWRDFPERQVFLDHRAYIPLSLLDKLDLFSYKPAVLDELHENYRFDSVLIEMPLNSPDILEIEKDTNWSLNHKGWALVFWDDVSLLYLKRKGKYDHLIKQYEYRTIKPANGRAGLWSSASKDEFLLSEKELKRNIRETDSSTAHMLLGTLYTHLGRYGEASSHFLKVTYHPLISHLNDARLGLSSAYFNLHDFDKAIAYLKESVDLNKSSTSLHDLGTLYFLKGDYKKAEHYLRESINRNKLFAPAYRKAMVLFKKTGETAKFNEIKSLLQTQPALNKAEAALLKGDSALKDKKYDLAYKAYDDAKRINPFDPEPFTGLAILTARFGNRPKAVQYLHKAISLNSFHPQLYAALAQIYSRQGNKKLANQMSNVFKMLTSHNLHAGRIWPVATPSSALN